MRCLFMILLVLSTVVVATPSGSAATTWFVDDCGGVGTGTKADPFCAIQAAVDAASAGDTIKVRAGRYTEQVMIDKSLKLLGAQAGITATKGRNDVGKESLVNSDQGSLILQADNITVDGFWAHDAWNGGPFGANIWLKPDSAGYRIVNNVVTGGTVGIGLGSDGAAQTVIARNRIANNNEAGSAAGTGIYGDTAIKNVKIVANRFLNNTSAAINLAGAPVKEGITIHRNSADTPIILYNTQISRVTRNKLNHSTGSALALFDDNSLMTISGNVISSPVYHGILFRLELGPDPSEGVRVIRNEIVGAGIQGIWLEGASVDDSDFTENIVKGSIGTGILIADGSNDNVFTANKVVRSQSGVDIEDQNDDVPVNLFVDNTCGTSSPVGICT